MKVLFAIGVIIVIYAVGLLLTALLIKIPIKGKSLLKTWEQNNTIELGLAVWPFSWISYPIYYFIHYLVKLGKIIAYAKLWKKDRKENNIAL